MLTVTQAFLGTIEYEQAYQLQLNLHAKVLQAATPTGGYLIGLEHPAVLTLGKNANEAFLNAESTRHQDIFVPHVRTDRGGEVTAHMPGQLVVYPILPIQALNLTVKKYVYLLEETVIRLLAGYGVHADRSLIYPGVWVGDSKICAIGIRIMQRVSLHGIALNVNNELELFKQIVPCGIRDKDVTSMKQHTGLTDLSPTQLFGHLTNIFSELFAINLRTAQISEILEG